MAARPSILAWRILGIRGAWQATVHGVAKNQTLLSTQHLLGETEILNMEIRVGLIKEEQ